MCIYLSTCKYIWWDYPINIYTICKISNLSSFQFWVCNITCIGTSNMEILRHLFPFILCLQVQSFLGSRNNEGKEDQLNFFENVFDIQLSKWKFFEWCIELLFYWRKNFLSYVIFWDQRTNSRKWIMWMGKWLVSSGCAPPTNLPNWKHNPLCSLSTSTHYLQTADYLLTIYALFTTSGFVPGVKWRHVSVPVCSRAPNEGSK